jgi:hypothetical protein
MRMPSDKVNNEKIVLHNINTIIKQIQTGGEDVRDVVNQLKGLLNQLEDKNVNKWIQQAIDQINKTNVYIDNNKTNKDNIKKCIDLVYMYLQIDIANIRRKIDNLDKLGVWNSLGVWKLNTENKFEITNTNFHETHIKDVESLERLQFSPSLHQIKKEIDNIINNNITIQDDIDIYARNIIHVMENNYSNYHTYITKMLEKNKDFTTLLKVPEKETLYIFKSLRDIEIKKRISQIEEYITKSNVLKDITTKILKEIQDEYKETRDYHYRRSFISEIKKILNKSCMNLNHSKMLDFYNNIIIKYTDTDDTDILNIIENAQSAYKKQYLYKIPINTQNMSIKYDLDANISNENLQKMYADDIGSYHIKKITNDTNVKNLKLYDISIIKEIYKETFNKDIYNQQINIISKEIGDYKKYTTESHEFMKTTLDDLLVKTKLKDAFEQYVTHIGQNSGQNSKNITYKVTPVGDIVNIAGEKKGLIVDMLNEYFSRDIIEFNKNTHKFTIKNCNSVKNIINPRCKENNNLINKFNLQLLIKELNTQYDINNNIFIDHIKNREYYLSMLIEFEKDIIKEHNITGSGSKEQQLIKILFLKPALKNKWLYTRGIILDKIFEEQLGGSNRLERLITIDQIKKNAPIKYKKDVFVLILKLKLKDNIRYKNIYTPLLKYKGLTMYNIDESFYSLYAAIRLIHISGFTHQNITPQNIHFTKEGQLKLLLNNNSNYIRNNINYIHAHEYSDNILFMQDIFAFIVVSSMMLYKAKFMKNNNTIYKKLNVPDLASNINICKKCSYIEEKMIPIIAIYVEYIAIIKRNNSNKVSNKIIMDMHKKITNVFNGYA